MLFILKRSQLFWANCHCHSSFGPTFRRDLHICDKSNEVGKSFSRPHSFLAGKTQNFLAGSSYFKVKEIEVCLIKD